MSSTFAWYADAGLTVPLTRGDFVRGSSVAPVNRVFYFGSPAAGKQLQNVNDPGIDPLQVSVTDSSGGSGVEAADVKLASSFAGLDSATGGAALSIGTTILSGAANAVPVFVRVSSALTAEGNYDDVQLRVADWLESDA